MKLAIVGHERCPAFSDLPDAISLGTNLLARGMARRGHDVTLFSPLPPLSAPATWPCRVEVFPGFKGADTSSFRFGANYFAWVEEVLEGSLKEVRFDAVYVANRPESSLSTLDGLSAPPIVMAHDTPPEYTRPSYWWWQNERTRHITCSTFMSYALWKVSRVPVEVVRHGFDLEVYREVPDQIRYPAVLFAGRHVVEKGITAAAEALQAIRGAKTLCGDGPCRVPFGVDHRPRNWGSEMPTWYSKHRVVVVPSIWPDPAPRVAMEALLCGCAVVHSGAGGLPEIEGENTFAFNYKGDLAEMVRLVQKILDMPEEEFRQQSAQSVTEARGRWSEARFLDDMERVFQEVGER